MEVPYHVFSARGNGRTANNVIQYLLDTRGWRLPRLVVSVAGASETLVLPLHLQDALGRGLRQVVETSDAWVVTGGTAGGLIGFAGRALARAQDAAEAEATSTQLLGFALAQDVVLSTEQYSAKDSELGSLGALAISDYQSAGPSTLEENHGMFILVDNPFVNKADGAVWQEQEGGQKVHRLAAHVDAVARRGLFGTQDRWQSLLAGLSASATAALHLVQLASTTGEESNTDHMWSALQELEAWASHREERLQVFLHLILDEESREGSPHDVLSGLLARLDSLPRDHLLCTVATVMDRRHAMNLDGEYSRTQVAFDAITRRGVCDHFSSRHQALEDLHRRSSQNASRDLPFGPYVLTHGVLEGIGANDGSPAPRSAALATGDAVCFLNLDPFGIRQLYYSIALPSVRREFMNGLWRRSSSQLKTSMMPADTLLELTVRTLVRRGRPLLGTQRTQ